MNAQAKVQYKTRYKMVRNSNDQERPSTLFIACGALAREIIHLKEATGWKELTVTCLPAVWHNTPKKIVSGVKEKIRGMGRRFERIFVLYGDCGTGGDLDRFLEAEQIDRIPGPHCYQFFMGRHEISAAQSSEPGIFFLTDYLVRHFEKIIIKGLGIDRFPELINDYFKNYKKVIYIAQTKDEDLKQKAERAAFRLGLLYEYRFHGFGELGNFMQTIQSNPDS